MGRDLMGMYPSDLDLVPELARYAQVSTDKVMVTNGSDQALEIILRAFLDPGDRLLVARPEFPMITQIAGAIGAEILGVPIRDNLEFPADEFERATDLKPDLIVFVNPNNPTGTMVEVDTIISVAKRCPNIPIVVDEAYFEYTGRTVVSALENHSNLIVARTFSKAFAMAGLRLGYIIAHPEIVADFLKIRGPFDVNAFALVAAFAHLQQRSEPNEHVVEVIEKNKPLVEAALRDLGVKFHAGPANFLLVWPDDVDDCVDYLRQRGILVRKMTAPLLHGAFRMSLGTEEEIRRFIDAFDAYIEQGTGQR